jgi:exodeoxyribonuclease-1
MLPLCRHPVNPKAVLCIDLSQPLADLLDLCVDDLQDRLFTPSADLPEGLARLAVKSVASNKVPFVAPANVLQGVDCDRIGLDVDACMLNSGKLDKQRNFAQKVAAIFRQRDFPEIEDPDFMLYSGNFFSPYDRQQMARVHDTPPENLDKLKFKFEDSRLQEMLFRYRARNYPDTLSKSDLDRWDNFRRERLLHQDSYCLGLEEYNAHLERWKSEADLSEDKLEIIDQLIAWPAKIGIPALQRWDQRILPR